MDKNHNVNYFWVNQGSNFRNELNDGILCSPQRDKRGSDKYKLMRDLRIGDIIINYRKPEIVAFSEVVENTYINENDYYEVKVKYTLLDKPIKKEEFKKRLGSIEKVQKILSNIQNTPFDKNFNVNLGYLFNINREIFDLIFNNNPVLSLKWWEIAAIAMYNEDPNKEYKPAEVLKLEFVKKSIELKNVKSPSIATELRECSDDLSTNYKRKNRNYFLRNGEFYKLSEEGKNYIQTNFQLFIKRNNLNFNHHKNQILYGPPGTGKTYNTVIRAMEIINNEKYNSVDNKKYKDLKKQFDSLKQQGQIEFVTFHQSYSYEEFVEGIKPDLKNNKLMYTLGRGIFKEICNSAKELLETKVKYNFKKDNISVYKILIPDESIFQYCIDNNCVAINWGDEIDISDCNTQEEIANKIPENFESRKQCISQLNLFKLWIDKDIKNGKDVIVVIPGSINTIKGIAKIAGNYYFNSEPENGHQQRKVEWIRKNINISSENIYNSKFVSPTITGMFNDKINWETFLNLINNNNTSKSSNAVLIIDEINRGDVSKIFGELITLIEEDKRIGAKYPMTVTLPYSRETFGVPNNLYIIGTMNTADRSIALLDTALRRRFDFEEMMPKPELLSGKNIEGVDLEELLIKINDRIKNEYDRDHQIGHSYLMGVENKEQLERAYKNRILPLLNEYFYNDIDSVAKVLNCKPDDISSKENWFNVLKEAQKPTKKDNEQ